MYYSTGTLLGGLQIDGIVGNVEEKSHSFISATIVESRTTELTFTMDWFDKDTCSGSYNLYMNDIEPTGVGVFGDYQQVGRTGLTGNGF